MDTASSDQPQVLQTVPSSAESEASILGAILVDNRVYERTGDLLSAHSFYVQIHQKLYEAISNLMDSRGVADKTTLQLYFSEDPDLKAVGGLDYLAEITGRVLTTAHAREHARIVHETHMLRELKDIGENISQRAATLNLDYAAVSQIEEAEKSLYDLATQGMAERSYISLNRAATTAITQIEEAIKRKSHITGITTGLRDLDHRLGGLQPTDLLILAGRPSMGKTSLATNIAVRAARAWLKSGGTEGAKVAFFSLEMSSEQLAMRILSDLVDLPSSDMRRGRIDDTQMAQIIQATQDMHDLPISIDETPALSITALRSRARRLKRKEGIGLIVVDYLQLMTDTSIRGDNRVQEVSSISRGLKEVAKDLNCPVIALSQLSRAVESRDDKRPQLADLRESGSIEQDADVVMFVYREEYYHERREPQETETEDNITFSKKYARWQARQKEIHNIAEVIVAKQRHGPIGTVKLHFDGLYTRFSDLEQSRLGEFEPET